MNMAEFGLTSLTFVDRTSPVKLNSPHIEHITFLGVAMRMLRYSGWFLGCCYAVARVLRGGC